MERFIDVFKRAIKKANGIKTENEELKEFLSIYRITPNPNTGARQYFSDTLKKVLQGGH